MSLKYLLDTNIISQAMRPSPNPNLVERLGVKRKIFSLKMKPFF